ncbi:transposase [Nocardia miyunensis]|uniref:transposase n=1 Tax=Nocardia miyunensis TaxID=282684 RepID=UPI000A861475|nr:transposase [Nocardia miyunensis]
MPISAAILWWLPTWLGAGWRNDLERQLRERVRLLAPSLLAVPGCGVLSAAVIIGETAGAQRFRSKDAYARFTGTAPIPVWSGSTSGKVRLNRGGNRWINCAPHMIALTQTRGLGPGKDYLDKLTGRGKARVEAMRLLRRRLSDVVYRALIVDERAVAQPADAPTKPAVMQAMAGRVADKVALITGAARGQGRPLESAFADRSEARSRRLSRCRSMG